MSTSSLIDDKTGEVIEPGAFQAWFVSVRTDAYYADFKAARQSVERARRQVPVQPAAGRQVHVVDLPHSLSFCEVCLLSVISVFFFF